MGKTAVARGLAQEIGAVHLRIDSIEQTMRNSSITIDGPQGYVVAYAVAADNLELGLTVVADSVNPVESTRSAWRQVSRQAGKGCVEIEVVCSDREEHRLRAERRTADIAGHRLPTWKEICDREYEPWEANIVLDTAGRHIEESVSALLEQLAKFERELRSTGEQSQ